jgi:hypothetical protein
MDAEATTVKLVSGYLAGMTLAERNAYNEWAMKSQLHCDFLFQKNRVRLLNDAVGVPRSPLTKADAPVSEATAAYAELLSQLPEVFAADKKWCEDNLGKEVNS